MGWCSAYDNVWGTQTKTTARACGAARRARCAKTSVLVGLTVVIELTRSANGTLVTPRRRLQRPREPAHMRKRPACRQCVKWCGVRAARSARGSGAVGWGKGRVGVVGRWWWWVPSQRASWCRAPVPWGREAGKSAARRGWGWGPPPSQNRHAQHAHQYDEWESGAMAVRIKINANPPPSSNNWRTVRVGRFAAAVCQTPK